MEDIMTMVSSPLLFEVPKIPLHTYCLKTWVVWKQNPSNGAQVLFCWRPLYLCIMYCTYSVKSWMLLLHEYFMYRKTKQNKLKQKTGEVFTWLRKTISVTTVHFSCFFFFFFLNLEALGWHKLWQIQVAQQTNLLSRIAKGMYVPALLLSVPFLTAERCICEGKRALLKTALQK